MITLLEKRVNQEYLQDMIFLDDVIWPLAKANNNNVQHDAFTCKAPEFGK
jgi:hypothetical protein